MYKRNEIIRQMQCIYSKVCYLEYLAQVTNCPIWKEYFIRSLAEENKMIKKLQRQSYRESRENIPFLNREKEFTLEELGKYNGSGNSPAYAAVNGVVYDVSNNITWAGGTHFGLYAGQDLTKQFESCHAGMLELLNKLPKVGIIKGRGNINA